MCFFVGVALIEDRDHLFFFCGFSKRVWSHVLHKCNIVNPPICLDDVTSLGLQKWGKKNLQANLCRLVFGPTIYNLWKNRNEIKLDMVVIRKQKYKF
jgi:hypothetical protein